MPIIVLAHGSVLEDMIPETEAEADSVTNHGTDSTFHVRQADSAMNTDVHDVIINIRVLARH